MHRHQMLAPSNVSNNNTRLDSTTPTSRPEGSSNNKAERRDSGRAKVEASVNKTRQPGVQEGQPEILRPSCFTQEGTPQYEATTQKSRRHTHFPAPHQPLRFRD
jgi:hypothetical protein